MADFKRKAKPSRNKHGDKPGHYPSPNPSACLDPDYKGPRPGTAKHVQQWDALAMHARPHWFKVDANRFILGSRLVERQEWIRTEEPKPMQLESRLAKEEEAFKSAMSDTWDKVPQVKRARVPSKPVVVVKRAKKQVSVADVSHVYAIKGGR